MAVIYLVDTNIVSEIAKARPSLEVRDTWNTHHAEVAVAAPTWHELMYGLHRLPNSQRKRGLQKFFADFRLPILPFDQAAAEWLGLERSRLSKIGRMHPFIDSQIAAIAATNNLILVTRNERDFADFQGVTVENWFVQ